jgi:carbon-monoxide dehydrogenase medium subunit
MEEFFTGNGETPNVLKPAEMLTEIQVPYMPKNAKGAFEKHSLRGSIDFGVADVAAVVTMGGGALKDARIVIGSVGPAVVRVREAEEILKGKRIDDEVLEEVGKTAVRGVRLVSGAQSSVYYRRKIIHVITKQVVRQAMGLS